MTVTVTVTREWSVKTGCHEPPVNVDRGLDLGTPGGLEWPFHITDVNTGAYGHALYIARQGAQRNRLMRAAAVISTSQWQGEAPHFKIADCPIPGAPVWRTWARMHPELSFRSGSGVSKGALAAVCSQGARA